MRALGVAQRREEAILRILGMTPLVTARVEAPCVDIEPTRQLAACVHAEVVVTEAAVAQVSPEGEAIARSATHDVDDPPSIGIAIEDRGGALEDLDALYVVEVDEGIGVDHGALVTHAVDHIDRAVEATDGDLVEGAIGLAILHRGGEAQGVPELRDGTLLERHARDLIDRHRHLALGHAQRVDADLLARTCRDEHAIDVADGVCEGGMPCSRGHTRCPHEE